jgi:hypothetical protein
VIRSLCDCKISVHVVISVECTECEKAKCLDLLGERGPSELRIYLVLCRVRVIEAPCCNYLTKII